MAGRGGHMKKKGGVPKCFSNQLPVSLNFTQKGTLMDALA